MSPHGHFSQVRGTVSAQQGPKPFCSDSSAKSRAQTGATPSRRFFGMNLFAGTRPQNVHGFWRVVAQCLSGAVALALLTVVCFRLQLNLATTACLYLIIIVLLSLLGSFLSAAVVSLIAVGCLAYYFAPPIFSFRVSDTVRDRRHPCLFGNLRRDYPLRVPGTQGNEGSPLPDRGPKKGRGIA